MSAIESTHESTHESTQSELVSGQAARPRGRSFPLPKTFAALRHRNYRLFLMGQLVSVVGTWMQNIAQGWLVYQLSGSELALGVVGFASALPALMLSPVAGVITDRFPKRNLLMATQAGAMLLALILAGLTFSGVVQVWHVVALAAAVGVVNAFDGPVRQAFVVEMVGHNDMPNAIALNSMTFNLGRIVGPAMGGALLVAVGAAWCFLLNGITFLAVLASLALMRLPAHEPTISHLSPFALLRGGLDYVARQPNLQALLLLALSFSIFGISYATVLPAFVDKALQQDADAFGLINAMTGVGAVLGALVVARYGDQGKRGQWMSYAVLGFSGVLVGFALIPSYLVVLLLAVGLGITFMMTFTLINTMLQTQVADEMRGRVLSLYTLTFFGFAPFGALMVGWLAETVGLREALVVTAVLSFVGAAAVLWRIPSVMKLP
jgi:MFS family permease